MTDLLCGLLVFLCYRPHTESELPNPKVPERPVPSVVYMRDNHSILIAYRAPEFMRNIKER